ncbi:SCO family protein [Hyphomicrobium sp. 99]|uniref:SCO family protein n=1 Tax=Hyphomicrobium sp. 99 TaxID=1163419 RepID=UPI0012E0AEED|nr:SCO family protein [Hyphomicrobium sp. 99]
MRILKLSGLPVAAAVVAMTVAGAAGLTWAWRSSGIATSTDSSFSTANADARWGGNYMPNVPVVDQDGNRFRFYDDLIKGKKVIINFIYTSCSQICPLTTSRLAMLQEKLGDAVGRDFFMYSISIDPEHDGPAELKKHAGAFHVGPGWRFLTGKPEDIAALRYKLGERAKSLKDHKQEILLGNDSLGSWSRDSVFGDLDQLALTIRSMDPDFRLADASASAAEPGAVELAPGQMLFASMCAGCHTVGGGDRAGPDLKNVASRRDREWIKSFVSRPDLMFARLDPIAMRLAEKFPAVRMPNLGLSPSDAEDVLSYVTSLSRPQPTTGVASHEKQGMQKMPE